MPSVGGMKVLQNRKIREGELGRSPAYTTANFHCLIRDLICYKCGLVYVYKNHEGAVT